MPCNRCGLTPVSNSQQTVLSWGVEIEGGCEQLTYRDEYGNQTSLVSVDAEADSVTLTAQGEVETLDTNGVLGAGIRSGPTLAFCAGPRR